MHPLRKWMALGLVLFVTAPPFAAAQIPGLSKPSEPAATEPASDPMGRSTPRGALVAFTRAVHREDFAAAARYLQLEGAQRRNAASLATELKSIIDRELQESISRISDEPTGALDDGLAEDRENIGPLDIDGKKTFITLVRVRDAQDGLIWLVSSETLRLVPAIAEAAGKTWIERFMPEWLLARELLGLSVAHWSVLAILALGSLTLFWLAGSLCNLIARRVMKDPVRRTAWDAWYRETRWPAYVALAILIHFIVIPELGFPLTFRVAYARFGLITFVVVMTWLLKRAMSLAFAHARGMVRGKNRASTQSLMLLAERMLQAVIVVIAIISVLILMGVESKTALAGLGVVGVALALGAQKTVENLLGGIFLLSDKALAVGDYCTIGNQSGTVEDVTLRSVRLRTTSQTLVSLPAGSLAQAGIENFASRNKILVNTTLRLRYGTTAEQLRRVLDGARGLITQNANIERDTCYVRLVNFGAQAIELELFAYVLTPDAEKFRAVREELLLQIAALVEAAGSALAPTQYIRMEGAREAGATDS